jgi:competence protein ComEC
MLAVLMAGAARYQSVQPEFTPTDLVWYNGRDVLLRAQVISFPETGSRSIPLRLDTEQLEIEGQAPQKVRGLLLAVLPPGEDWRYGDILLLQGRLAAPQVSGDFSYSDYLARQGIHAQIFFPRATLVARGQGSPIKAVLFALRNAADRTIKSIFPSPEAALLSGILLGLDGDLPLSLQNAFRDTGTSHIIAISGFNIAILAGLFSFLASRLFSNRWLALGVSIVGIIFYTVLVGAQASVVRAAVMGGLGLFGQHIGRRRFGLNILAFTAAAMSFANPFVLWDISFQLSFAATLGLVLYADRLQGWFIRLVEPRLGTAAHRLAGPAGEYILFTLAAQVTTLPILVYHFHRLSMVSLIANPLILPPQPLVMILGGFVTLVGMVFPPLGKLLALLIWPLLAYTTRLAEWLSSFPISLTLGETTWWGVLLFYILLFFLSYKPSFLAPRRWLKIDTGLVALALLTILTWKIALSIPDGRLHWTVFNSGGIASSFIRAPDGQSVLINGGPDPKPISSALGRQLSPIDHHLDAFLLTATSGKGMEGLDNILNLYPPRRRPIERFCSGKKYRSSSPRDTGRQWSKARRSCKRTGPPAWGQRHTPKPGYYRERDSIASRI